MSGLEVWIEKGLAQAIEDYGKSRNKVWESKHPMMPYDKGQFSHKFNHGALKYEIAIDVYRSKVVWISGPHRAGLHDKTIFVEKGLKDKIPLGKKVISDRIRSPSGDTGESHQIILTKSYG